MFDFNCNIYLTAKCATYDLYRYDMSVMTRKLLNELYLYQECWRKKETNALLFDCSCFYADVIRKKN